MHLPLINIYQQPAEAGLQLNALGRLVTQQIMLYGVAVLYYLQE